MRHASRHAALPTPTPTPTHTSTRARWMARAWRAGLACVPLASGCWPGWMELFNPTPSREHIVEDLRVLAVEVEPASVSVPTAVAYGGDDDALVTTLRIRPRVFDPRGGDVVMGVSVCSALDAYTPCTGEGITFTPRTVRADADAPLGAVPVEDAAIDVPLTRGALVRLWADADAPFPSLAPITLVVQVAVSRDVGGITERELASLPLVARVDPTGDGIPAEDLDAVSLVRCASLDEDAACGGVPTAVCGDGVVGAGESCDPPVLDLCSAECQSIAFCPIGLVRTCARPATDNVLPRMLGLVRTNNIGGVLFDVEPDVAPGARFRATRGERLSIVPVLAQADIELRVGVDRVLPYDESPDDRLDGACPALVGYTCPNPETWSVRWYVGASDVDIVAPSVSPENESYEGNIGGTRGVTLAFGEDAREVPLVVVLSDGVGGMRVETFVVEVE